MLAMFLASLVHVRAWAQTGAQASFQQQGYVEYRGFAFPQTTRRDSGHAIGEALIRYDVVYQLGPHFRIQGGTETRSDTHRQTEREFKLNWDDRGLRRPNFSIRRFSVSYNRGPVTVEAGKQLIRWGRADLLNPTDRFTPRDYLSVVDSDPLAVTAGRIAVEGRRDSLEVVLQPMFTPSRMPLLNQRWTVMHEGVLPQDRGSRIPGGVQWGVRWNHTRKRYEASLSHFDGHHHLPLFTQNAGAFQRYFPRSRTYGADVLVPVKGLAFKGETAYFTSSTREADEYVLYVAQVARKSADWSVVAGYAGEVITRRGNGSYFAPDRSLARAFLGRATYSIDTKRSFTLDAAVRESGSGIWVRPEYSHSWNTHWTTSLGLTFLGGNQRDFFGQYRRNSFIHLAFRYSF